MDIFLIFFFLISENPEMVAAEARVRCTCETEFSKFIERCRKAELRQEKKEKKHPEKQVSHSGEFLFRGYTTNLDADSCYRKHRRPKLQKFIGSLTKEQCMEFEKDVSQKMAIPCP